ncbi:MAG: hypothetical protein A3B23_02380 [Candidatus Colwellbacteria bacterium RIFCSPLOWO2_01_FULL_48_10]|uniref:Uncharacterized protein n=2 Tax=Bacteria candidate phyla TaxID=1783234 RepID=A0A1F5P3T4_9BACT|nr:MAG: hypothetical protein A2846_03570 [Candidatus Doudnabacteria bacterium RIFCSPHIGHO2_01_FULL_49_9]OGY59969.1 MAG: hypothetical protein A3B23_02380 [Candidatus Colwellbacteria bacterium RIFCSPLOWO2_01_FULL_48_10]
MSEQEIIKQISRLSKIAPEAEYATVSRLLILASKDAAYEMAPEKAFVETVSALRNVAPSHQFAAESRELLIAHPRTILEKAVKMFSPRNLAYQGVNYGLSVVMASVLFAIVIGGASALFRAAPGIDGSALTAEAQSVIKDIDIHLEEAGYFIVTADKARVALGDATGNGPEHANQRIIEKENRDMQFNDPTNRDIDELLNQATL